MKPKILLTHNFLEPLRPLLSSSFEILNYWQVTDKASLESVQAIASTVWDNIDAEFMKQFPRLKIISHMAVGTDAIDVIEAKKRGMVVTNTQDLVTKDTADLAMALLIACARRVVANDHYVRSGLWGKAPMPPLNCRLSGKKVGIVGLGRIGCAIAQRAAAFELDVSYWGRNKKENAPYKFEADLVTLAKTVDFLVISYAGVKEARHLINEKVLNALGPQAFLINVSRGFIVQQDALVDVLVNKKIAGAGLDVFEDEPHVPAQLLAMDNVVLQPHVGSATVETRAAMYQLVADNLLQYFKHGQVLTAV